MNEFEVGLKLTADGAGLHGQLRITREQFEKLGDSMDGTNKASRRAGEGVSKYGNEATKAKDKTKSLDTSTSNLTKRFFSLKTMVGTLGLGFLTRELVGTAAEMQRLDTRLKRLSGSSVEYADNQAYIQNLSKELNRELSLVADSYARILTLQKADMVSKTEGRQILEGLIDAQASLGATNAQLQQSMFGMQQGFSSGILRAEELNQVTEPLPGLLQELDKAAGLTGGGFRRMVNDGEVTSAFFKTTLISALQTYEGAAKATALDLSQRYTQVRNAYTLMAAKLQEPLSDVLGPLATSATAFLTALSDNMPVVLSSLGLLTEMLMIGGGLYLGLLGVSKAGKIFAATIAAAKFVVDSFVVSKQLGVSVFQFYTNSTLLASTATTAFSVSLKSVFNLFVLVTASLAAGWSVGQWLNNFQVIRTASQRFVGFMLKRFEDLKFAGKATWLSFESSFDLASSGIKLKYANLLDLIASGLDKIGADDTAKIYSDYAAKLRDGSDAAAVYVTKLAELNLERTNAIAEIDRQTEAFIAADEARNKLTDSTDAQTDAEGEASTALRASAENLAAVAKEEDEAFLRKLDRMDQLIEQFAPLQSAEVAYQEQLELLNLAMDMGYLTAENYSVALKDVNDQYQDLINPAGSYIDNLAEGVSLLEEENAAIRTGNVQRLAELELRRQGVTATAAQIDELTELLTRQAEAEAQNAALTDQADPFGEAWDNAIRRVDDAWFNFIRNGFDGFKNWKSGIIDLAKDMAAELVSIWTKQKMFGSALALSGGMALSGGASASTPGGEDIAASLVTSGLSAFTNGAANASFIAGDLLQKVGLDGLSDMAANRGVDLAMGGNGAALTDIGLSALAGYAGSFAGNELGQAVFNKQAESNVGAQVGGSAGAIIGGPLGAFIGSTIGSLVDVAFGGDGMKRFSLGIGAGGADPVKAKHISGYSVLESGLQISHVARRVSDEMLDPLLESYQRIDSAFSQITRGAGFGLDFTNLALKGTNADAGSNADGSFFGLRGENGLPADSETLLQEQFTDFAKQLIDNVPGLSTDITDIIRASTGDADEVLTQYRDLLSLESLFDNGQLFTDLETFTDTFQFFTDNLQRDGEVLGDAITRVAQAAGLLRQIGIGDGSSGSALFADQVSDQVGIENLAALVTAYNDIYLNEAERISSAVESLTDQVSTQLDGLGLSIDNFTSLESFRTQFESVKESLDAVDLATYLQAAVGLGQLIDLREQEAVAVAQTSSAISSSMSQFTALVGDTDQLINQVRSVGLSLQNQIQTLLGATPLHPSAISGTASERLQAVQELQRFYTQSYAEQLSAAEALHNLEMSHYEERLSAQRSLDTFIRGLGFSDLSPVTATERLSLAGQEFNRLLEIARSSGDATAVGNAQDAARTYLDLARTQEASSQAFVDIYNTTLGALTDLHDSLGAGSAPGAFNSADLDQVLIDQLEGLQNELVGIERESQVEIVSQLASLNVKVGELSEALQEQLGNISSAGLVASLDTANSFGLLRSDVVNALGLLPQEVDLSQTGIASALQSLTSIGNFDQIFSAGFDSLANIVGSVANDLLSQGVSSHLLADLIAQNEQLTAAANQYLANIGSPDTLSDFQSSQNSSISNADIAAYVATLSNDAAGQGTAIRWAIANGIGSGQLADSIQGLYPGITQQDVLQIASDLDIGSFRSGTDGMKKDSLNWNHEGEIIFSPSESNDLRTKIRKVVGDATEAGSTNGIDKIAEAIHSMASSIEESKDSSGRDERAMHEEMITIMIEVKEELERLRLQVEDQAA
ncbi:MAG: hypothetical protein DHS20C12_11990 [Pseudohongiella sp.]|nr:MAG: hypothetical protein DHS20C12_11990 [Pseudohongiella sp.]